MARSASKDLALSITHDKIVGDWSIHFISGPLATNSIFNRSPTSNTKSTCSSKLSSSPSSPPLPSPAVVLRLVPAPAVDAAL
ncbi:hypothetical protein C8034_v001664 [Colletotrichum sidae]|uniref:Uncharacterized protein n=1 Tax=Colletotrichum sidae TaxID=1347389 RepID=A0A4V3I2V2_9PEZI|nr:hypothetical protein C8034_v001664 [Colletotrichum sidae]